MRIRLAEVSDASQLWRLNREFNGADNTSSESEIAESLSVSPEIVMVAEQDGALVGFLCAHISRSMCYQTARGEIRELFVSPMYRKLGVGRGLLEEAERYFWEKRISVVTLYTSVSNAGAQTFYERCGYQKKSRIEYRKEA